MSMMYPRTVLVVCLALTLISPANAQTQTTNLSRQQMDEFRICLTNSASQEISKSQNCDGEIYSACTQTYVNETPTMAMLECTNLTSRAWDNVLNEIWPVTLAKLTPAAKNRLRRAQRVWITSRTADCEAKFEAHSDGTLGGLSFSACMVGKTMDRYFWLRDFYPD